jgi:hypothetical protein
LIIAVPLEASLPTLVSQTISICAFHAELEMNVGLPAMRRQSGSNIVAAPHQTVVGATGSIARRSHLPAGPTPRPRIADVSYRSGLKAVVTNTSCPQ